MSFHDESPGSLFDLMTGDLLIHRDLADGADARSGVVGAISLPSLDADTAAAIVKSVLEIAAKTFGDQAADLVISQKDTIRKILGPVTLEVADKIVHGLQDLKIALQ